MAGLHNEPLNYIEWSHYPIWNTQRKIKYLGSSEVFRRAGAKHYARTRLVRCELRSVLRRMQCSRWREGRVRNRRQSLPPAPVIKKLLRRSPSINRKISKNPSKVQKMTPTPDGLDLQKGLISRQVVVSH